MFFAVTTLHHTELHHCSDRLACTVQECDGGCFSCTSHGVTSRFVDVEALHSGNKPTNI